MSLGIETHRIRRLSGTQRTTIDGHTLDYRKGKDWYVDASKSATGGGTSWEDAFLTMQEAFNVLVGGETIYFAGTIREQLITPVQVFDVRVVGMGNRPRHADSTPSGGNTYANSWRAPASGATVGKATVRVLQQGWSFENILFTMEGSTAAGVEIVRDAGAGNAERDGSHCSIIGCRFAGAGVGVRSGVAGSYTEIVFNVLVDGNIFQDNTTAISGINGNQWTIVNNIFRGCTDAINVTGPTDFNISNNVFSNITTKVIFLTSGSANAVHFNALPGTYTTGANYQEGTSDDWNGNAASTGYTAAVP